MKTLITAIWFTFIGVGLGMLIAVRSQMGITEIVNIPTRAELQQALGVKPDGRIGPKTIAAWAAWEKGRFNEFAEEYFTKSGAPRQ